MVHRSRVCTREANVKTAVSIFKTFHVLVILVKSGQRGVHAAVFEDFQIYIRNTCLIVLLPRFRSNIPTTVLVDRQIKNNLPARFQKPFMQNLRGFLTLVNTLFSNIWRRALKYLTSTSHFDPAGECLFWTFLLSSFWNNKIRRFSSYQKVIFLSHNWSLGVVPR